MKIKYLILLCLGGLVIALDQYTKMLIYTSFNLGDSLPVFESFFNLTYVGNPGAAFGFLAQSHPEFRDLFFLIIPPLALIIILMILKDVADDDKWQILALSLVFGGAIGNYIDRLRFGFVVDFIDFHYKNQWSYPAFNVADMAIVCGIFILIGLMFKDHQIVKKFLK